MIFWGIFFFIGIVACSMQFYLPKNQQKYVTWVYIFFIWAISAFRYQIGTDYDMYAEYFYTLRANNIEDIFGQFIEPTYLLLVSFLGMLGAAPQMMFAIYTTITIFFLYSGLKYYIKDYQLLLVALVIYVLFPSDGGYWWSMNGMRQAAAVSIFFWCSRYIFEEKPVLFFVGTICAATIHFSAIAFIPCYLLIKLKVYPKINISLILIALMSTLTGLSAKAGMAIFSLIFSLSMYDKYEETIIAAPSVSNRPSALVFFLIIIYIFSIYRLRNANDKRILFFINGGTLYLLIKVLTSFSLEGSVFRYVIHRFDPYLLMFFLCLISIAVYDFCIKQKLKHICVCCIDLVLIALVVLSLRNLNAFHYNSDTESPYVVNSSTVNIDYKCNLDLFE